MKILIVLISLFSVVSPSFSAPAEKSSNYPQYNLNNVVAYEVSEDATTLFTLEYSESGITFVSRNIATGDPVLNISLDIPEAYFMNTVIADDQIYIFAVVILSREKRLMETSVIHLNTATGQTKTIYNSEEQKGIAEKFYATEKGLLLTEKRGNSPFFYNFESNEMTAIDLPEDYRIRSFDLGKNSAIIVQQSNFSTNSESHGGIQTYTEGEGNPLDVYLCDFSNKFKLNKIGDYQPSYVISTTKGETSLPRFTFNSDGSSWVAPSFIMNSFPLYPGALIGDKALYGSYESLNNHEMINELSFVNDQYIIAKQFTDMGEKTLAVFDIKNPKMSKDETVAKEDREKIRGLFREQFTAEKTMLDPAVISQVFDASFFKIDLVTTVVDSSDGMISTSTSTESFMAVARNDEYSVFKQNEEMVAILSEDFILNEKSAIQFQDCLDLLFPLGHFDKKHQAFYKKDDSWVFVRGESFGAKSGIVVRIDGDGKIVAVKPDKKISLE